MHDRVVTANDLLLLRGSPFKLDREVKFRYAPTKNFPSNGQRSIRIVDANGDDLPVCGSYMGTFGSYSRFPLTGGRSPVVVTSERAAKLIVRTNDYSSGFTNHPVDVRCDEIASVGG